MRTGNPKPLEVVFVHKNPDARQIERYWHAVYRARHVYREWFDLSDADVNRIRTETSTLQPDKELKQRKRKGVKSVQLFRSSSGMLWHRVGISGHPPPNKPVILRLSEKRGVGPVKSYQIVGFFSEDKYYYLNNLALAEDTVIDWVSLPKPLSLRQTITLPSGAVPTGLKSLWDTSDRG